VLAPPHPLVRYAAALAAVAAAFGLWFAFDSLLAPTPYPLLLGAVLLGAWYGGLGPGLVATMAAALANDYLVIPPVHSIGLFRSLNSGLNLLVFLLEGSGLTLLIERLRQASQRAEAARAEAAALRERERAAREEAEAAVQLRDEFLSVAAHELKTPITSLRSYAQLLGRELAASNPPEATRARRAVQTISAQSEKLTQLIAQLLDVSRIRSGRLALEPRPTAIYALAREVVAAAQPRSDGQRLVLSGDQEAIGLVDPLRLEQVLNNLLDNALKYGQGGEVGVGIVQRDAATVQIAVRDHGLGIPPDKRGAIFERYYRAHADRQVPGMGLGLYICREIVELHGGRIWAEFPDDGGARIVLTVPAAKTELAPGGGLTAAEGGTPE
jgi:signal transduction histidine kinase